MSQEIKTIGLGGVNCYLVKAGDGFILVDTGLSTKRAILDRELGAAGCPPGDLKLIVLTHGDVDHAGNAAYLREKYGTRIAMHDDDAGMVERGDMSWNRKAKPDKVSILGRVIMLLSKIVLLFGGSDKLEVFKPDVFLEDGYDLSGYGFDAKVIHIPGHSKGSIGVLTASGDLVCGDLFADFIRPAPHFLIDDSADYTASLERLQGLRINTVYPGHGKPFPLERLMKNR